MLSFKLYKYKKLKEESLESWCAEALEFVDLLSKLIKGRTNKSKSKVYLKQRISIAALVIICDKTDKIVCFVCNLDTIMVQQKSIFSTQCDDIANKFFLDTSRRIFKFTLFISLFLFSTLSSPKPQFKFYYFNNFSIISYFYYWECANPLMTYIISL